MSAAKALAYCPRCELPAPEGRCPRCSGRRLRAIAYRNSVPEWRDMGPYTLLVYRYGVRGQVLDALDAGRVPVPRAPDTKRGHAAEYIAVPYRREGATVIPTDLDRRKPIPARVGACVLFAVVTSQGLARGKLHVRWQCEQCGATGRMLASAWVHRGRTQKLRGRDCEYCAVRKGQAYADRA